jgi:predicted extracellular nuclease
VLDSTPWAQIVDDIAVTDGGSSDRTYAGTVLDAGFDGGIYTVGGASRIPNGTDTDTVADWVRNDFDGYGFPGFVGSQEIGEAVNTPGAMNEVITVIVDPFGACGDPATLIHEIQGSGLASTDVGNVRAVEAVVVATFYGPDQIGGYFLQEEDDDADADPLTSEGLRIFDTANTPSEGDVVRIRGSVTEFFDLTELNNVSDFALCGTGVATAAQFNLPVSSIDDFEAFEGMLVTFPQSLSIVEYFNFDRFGEIVLATDRQFQPTAVYEPGSPEAAQLLEHNLLNRIKMDDGRGNQNPDPAIHPNGLEFNLDNLFRGGDLVTNLTGVLDYNFGEYKVQPVAGADYTPVNERPVEHEPVGGNLKVASFNVLNYFTTIDDGSAICGPSGDMGCRGADTPEEFARQRAKIISALVTLDADVVGLIEIENNPYEAVADLVAGLNAVMGAGTYAYVDTGYIGTDAIKQAFIYKPASVSLVGDYAVLDGLDFTDPNNTGEPKNRPALAQTFLDNQTGGVFTAVVNHLKSKGSECGEGDDDPEQGSCNLTRALAAQVLSDWLATDPTGSGDADFLIIGDLNAYDKEDPIDVFVANGYADLLVQFQGEYAYSYVFDGQLGYLDYAMGGLDLLQEITGVAVWHINADEADLIDYDMSFKQDAQDDIYAPDAYRSSDHDPVVVGLQVCDEIAPTAQVTVTPDTLWPANHKYVDVTAMVLVDDNFDPNPTIELVSVESNEPDNGEDDGDTVNDIVIDGDFSFKLRAERSGVGTGRIYTITYKVTDACGNETFATATVTVPLSQGEGE